MYKVTGYFKEHKVVGRFVTLYDAIDFKDNVDAHYPLRLTMEKVIDMREFIYDSWNSVMNMEKNPLRHIPDVLDIWFYKFGMDVVHHVSLYLGSMWVFGITAIMSLFLRLLF